MGTDTATISIPRVRRQVRDLLVPERGFIRIVLVYGLAIGLLTLAVPISVQTLINTVANIASVRAVVILSILLLSTLLLSGFFSALRTHMMERYERHLYARLTAEISVRTLMAKHEYFEGSRNTDITNRYFDIITFQKNVPVLLVDGFALILQMIVGFTLVSFYHPTFLLFNIVLVSLLYLIWLIWGRGAIRSAVNLSHAKYATAKWLGDVAAAHEFFKSSRSIDYARQQTDVVTAEYIKQHRSHFVFTFSQTIMFLLIYAIASSALLGIGGFLVIRGELSIGQLVAAELILTAIFFGLSQFANYLKLYYELCGAADELGQVFDVPLESFEPRKLDAPQNGTLQFRNVVTSHLGEKHTLDFCLPSGQKAYALTNHGWLQRTLIHLLKHHQDPEQGWIRLGGADLRDYDVQQLRQAVAVIDRQLIIECTIEEFMSMSAPDATRAEINDALSLVGLTSTIEALPDRLGTRLAPMGGPLQPHEFLLLKLASAVASKPQMVVITQYFDNMPAELLRGLLEKLKTQPFTVLYFTNHPELEVFNYSLALDWPNQHLAVDACSEGDL